MSRAQHIEAAAKALIDALRFAHPTESEDYGCVLVCAVDEVLDARYALSKALKAPEPAEKLPVSYPLVKCSVCGRKVRENWLIRHLHSDCKVGNGNGW